MPRPGHGLSPVAMGTMCRHRHGVGACLPPEAFLLSFCVSYVREFWPPKGCSCGVFSEFVLRTKTFVNLEFVDFTVRQIRYIKSPEKKFFHSKFSFWDFYLSGLFVLMSNKSSRSTCQYCLVSPSFVKLRFAKEILLGCDFALM